MLRVYEATSIDEYGAGHATNSVPFRIRRDIKHLPARHDPIVQARVRLIPMSPMPIGLSRPQSRSSVHNAEQGSVSMRPRRNLLIATALNFYRELHCNTTIVKATAEWLLRSRANLHAHSLYWPMI